MRIGVISLFPEMFAGLTDFGIAGRAIQRGLLDLQFWNPRDFTTDKHRTVDDRPYGGGPGMLMKVQPLRDAIAAARHEIGTDARVAYMSPQGKPLKQRDVIELAGREKMIFVAGRYEGIDERVIEADVDEQWSIGDYVLSGGEFAAMVMLDAMIRWLPGSLGHEESATQDSFTDGLLDCPHYTRPEVLDGQAVPQVLVNGHHEQIRQWRLQQALARTWQQRPELLAALELNEEQQRLLDEFLNGAAN